jgi:hypothetical protein
MRLWAFAEAVEMISGNVYATRVTMMRQRHLILLAFTILVVFVAAITLKARKAADRPSINDFSMRGANPAPADERWATDGLWCWAWTNPSKHQATLGPLKDLSNGKEDNPGETTYQARGQPCRQSTAHWQGYAGTNPLHGRPH